MENELIQFKIANASLTIIPRLSGCIADLELFNGQSSLPIIDGYQSFDDAVAKSYFKSHFLMPFPNRLKDGQFQFEGKNYEFPINDVNNHHNLHGFLECIPMEIVNNQVFDNQMVIDLKGKFEGLNYFPFPFEIKIQYNLSAAELTVRTTIKNIGTTNLPFGYGWHPYFKLDTQKVDNLSMQLPDCQLVDINNRMMPTGLTKPYEVFSSLSRIGVTTLDNCFLLNENIENRDAAIILKSETTTLSVWQNTGKNACNYFQIYTPDNRKSIAIEPMTCNIDVLNNQEGLWVLEVEEERSVTFGIKILDAAI